jgi:hypothetical protein
VNVGHEVKCASQVHLDIFWPVGTALIVSILFGIMPIDIQILSDNGFLKHSSGFLQFAASFYVASLAVIATFPSENMDVPRDESPL